MTDAFQSFDSQDMAFQIFFLRDMEYTLFTLERRNPFNFQMIDAIVVLLLFPVTRTQQILMRDGVHNIFSREMKYKTFTH